MEAILGVMKSERCIKIRGIFVEDGNTITAKTYEDIEDGWTKFEILSSKDVTVIFKRIIQSFQTSIAIFSGKEAKTHNKNPNKVLEKLRDTPRKLL